MYLRLGLGNEYEEQEKYYEQKALPPLYISENEINGKLYTEKEMKIFEKQYQRRLKKLELDQQKKNVDRKVGNSSTELQVFL